MLWEENMSKFDVLLIDYLVCEEGVRNVTPRILVREKESMLEVFGSEEKCIEVLNQYLGRE
jgi:hypothetical protein